MRQGWCSGSSRSLAWGGVGALVALACGHRQPPPIAPPPVAPPRAVVTPASSAEKVGSRYAAVPPQPPEFTDPERPLRISELVPELEKHVDAFFAAHQPPSLAVTVIVDGKPLLTRVLGVRDKASKAPATEQSLYRIGSVTKTFTATTVLALRDAGLIRLDSPAEAYVPELERIEYPFRDSTRFTVRQLLNHTSGLQRLGDLDYSSQDRDLTEADVLDTLERSSLVRAPGTGYEYSNFGIQVLGLVIARTSPERSFRTAVAQRVTGPLGMTRTTFDPASVPGAELTSGYDKASDRQPAVARRRGVTEASGGLWSTPADMGRWVAAQLDAWPARDAPEQGPIARASLREAHTGSVANGFNASVDDQRVKVTARSVGFGWHVSETCDYERLVEHNGKTEGHSASLVFAPERGFGFVILANSADAPTDTLQETLLAASTFLARREPLPSPKTIELLNELVSTLGKMTVLTYDELFTDIFRAHISLSQLNELGKQLLSVHGACSVDRALSVRGPFEGKFALACDRGRIELEASVQLVNRAARFGSIKFSSVGFAPAKETLRAAAAFLKIYEKWDSARYRELFAKPESEGRVRAAAEAMKAKVGMCRLEKRAEKVLTGNARFRAVFRLMCDKPSANELELDLDKDGKISTIYLRSPKAGRGRCAAPVAPVEAD